MSFLFPSFFYSKNPRIVLSSLSTFLTIRLYLSYRIEQFLFTIMVNIFQQMYTINKYFEHLLCLLLGFNCSSSRNLSYRYAYACASNACKGYIDCDSQIQKHCICPSVGDGLNKHCALL